MYAATIKALSEQDAAEALKLSFNNRSVHESMAKLERRRESALDKATSVPQGQRQL
jgi:hypothetical protein